MIIFAPIVKKLDTTKKENVIWATLCVHDG